MTEKRILFAYKTHLFLTHSPVTGCLGWFMSLAVVNRVAESFDAQDSVRYVHLEFFGAAGSYNRSVFRSLKNPHTDFTMAELV